jgi:hypothetical protein
MDREEERGQHALLEASSAHLGGKLGKETHSIHVHTYTNTQNMQARDDKPSFP